jgi:secreted trypsin-like serine protease
MVATALSYSDQRYNSATGLGYDGVVLITVGNGYGTGTLLYDGRAVLTAAHVAKDVSLSSISVKFETFLGLQALSVSKASIYPSYDAPNENGDLALLWLSTPAPTAANRYTLYRATDEIGQDFSLVGYGEPGTGSSGAMDTNAAPVRRKAENRFDADMATLKDALGNVMGWTPSRGAQLAADFDNGSATQDALGRLANISDLGLGSDEGMLTPGDSGGPAFIDGKIAGVASYGVSLYSGSIHPDVDARTNGSFGEIGAWQRVSHYQQWIDQSIRTELPGAPATAQDVQRFVVEGAQTAYTYFMVEYHGERSDPSANLQVEYATRNGTATAGQDYLATSGTLVLYPGESRAVIPVEILSDTLAEGAETLYLDIFNPVGGTFAGGVSILSAMRTIFDA